MTPNRSLQISDKTSDFRKSDMPGLLSEVYPQDIQYPTSYVNEHGRLVKYRNAVFTAETTSKLMVFRDNK